MESTTKRDLARTPHSGTRIRAMAGIDLGNQPTSSSSKSLSSSTQSVIRFPKETETSEQSMSMHNGGRLQIATKTINALPSRRRNAGKRVTLLSSPSTSSSNSASSSYSQSIAPSRAHSTQKQLPFHHSRTPSTSHEGSSGVKFSSHHSKSPSASHAPSSGMKFSSHHSKASSASHERSSGMKSSFHHSRTPSASHAPSSGMKFSSHHSKSPSASHAPSSNKKSASHYSKPVLSRSRLPYHERASRRERSSRKSIELATRIQRGKEEEAQKEKEEMVVFNVRKRVLVNLLKSLYDQPDDTTIAIRLQKDQLRTVSEHEASKERRRQRHEGE